MNPEKKDPLNETGLLATTSCQSKDCPVYGSPLQFSQTSLDRTQLYPGKISGKAEDPDNRSKSIRRSIDSGNHTWISVIILGSIDPSTIRVTRPGFGWPIPDSGNLPDSGDISRIRVTHLGFEWPIHGFAWPWRRILRISRGEVTHSNNSRKCMTAVVWWKLCRERNTSCGTKVKFAGQSVTIVRAQSPGHLTQ